VQRRAAKRYGLFHYASKQGVMAAPDLRPDTRRKEAPARFAGALVIKSNDLRANALRLPRGKAR